MKTCKYCNEVVENTTKKCPSCGGYEFLHICENCSTKYEGNYCPNCGVKKGKKGTTCPVCGNVFFTNACPNCGYSTLRKNKSNSNSRSRTSPPQQSAVKQETVQKAVPANNIQNAVQGNSRKRKKRHPIRWLIFIILLIVIFGSRSQNNEPVNTNVPSTKGKATSTIMPQTTKPSSAPEATATLAISHSTDGNMLFIPASESAEENKASLPQTEQSSESASQGVIIYEYDTTINKFINQLNAVMPEKHITSSQIIRSSSDGEYHDQEATLTLNGFHLLIKGGVPITVIVTNHENQHADYEGLFSDMAKAFLPGVTEEQIKTGWAQLTDKDTHMAEFDNFACAVQLEKEAIVQMIFEGEL